MTNAELNAELNARFTQILSDLGWKNAGVTPVFDAKYDPWKYEVVLSHLHLDGLLDSDILLALHAQERLKATGSDRVTMLQMEHCSNKLFPVAEAFCGTEVVVEQSNAFGEEFDHESVVAGVKGYLVGIDDPFEDDAEDAFDLGDDALYNPRMSEEQWLDWYTYWVDFAHQQVQRAVDDLMEASRPALALATMDLW